eukprot:TRINITY_DN13709_c0_g1_i1.p1 TRINITY_DN13709_c0_g1~~TRINITY_DN13709_c0_g1_i1.p1  ORF type:complete len:112 (+),score=4.10 TRINITY_DN13709_c0_g1_i1:42-377(+)
MTIKLSKHLILGLLRDVWIFKFSLGFKIGESPIHADYPKISRVVFTMREEGLRWSTMNSTVLHLTRIFQSHVIQKIRSLWRKIVQSCYKLSGCNPQITDGILSKFENFFDG